MTIQSKAPNAYETAFLIDVGGLVVLLPTAAVVEPLAVLSALAVWTLVTMFVLPWLVRRVRDAKLSFPPWFYRGPHG